SPSGLAAYEAEREAFVGPRAAADPERVESLRALERRLEEALPDALGPHQVAATLGSSWIPPTVILDFMRETFGAGEAQGAASGRRLEVARDPSTGSWRVRATSSGLSPEAQARWGTAECSCFHLVETALNGSVLAVTRPDPDDPSGRRRVRDPQATAAAWQRRHRIEEAFAEWVWSDEDRSRMLCEIYNRQFNGLAPRRYDGSYLTLPGMSPSVTLERHQLDAVARILQSDEGTLVAHAVGAGKTFTGIVACHEAKRLGNASKPMIVVPNHITQQWASDFLRLYPDAKVLYMDAADTRNADAVRAFWARAAAGDWDAVIVGQSRFSQLNVSAETRERYFEARLEEMERSIRAAKEDGQDFTVKEAERTKRQLQGRLDRLRRDRSLAGISFEDLGCDMLVVDEAHSFKNLAVTGVQTAGMAVSPSAKCEDLLDKCRWLRERGKGRNIVFETGTPVSNTMAELYNMQRYLSPALLAAQGVESFSSWANTFGQLTESVEVRPEGTGFQIKQRFGRFHNLPELMGAFHCFADVMTAETLDLPVPECEVVTVAVPATPEQEECVRELAKRAEAVRDRSVDPSDDNMLRITGDGRKVALDPKLLSPDDPDVAPLEGGKVARCAEEVKRIWDETSAERGAQLVFCDTSTPAGGGWNVYVDLKRRLVELGVPEDEVRFVSDAGDNPTKRDELFEMVRAGEVRVLVGSTQKLGTGTNCQDRLAAIHDLDCPWRPSDLEQRLGRIRRRGNMYDRVRDYRYVSTGTFDAYLYQIVERKQRFIGQVFTDRSPARAVDDLDETVLSFAEIKMLATGDPDVARRMELENEIGQLRLLEQAHASQAASIARQVECRYRPQAEALRERSEQLGRDEAAFLRATDASLGDNPPVEVGGAVLGERDEAVRALRSAALGLRTGSSGRIGAYRGLDVWAERRQALGGRDGIECVTHVGLAARGSDSVHWCDKPFPASDTGPGTVLRQMDRLAEREARGPELVAERLEEAERRLAEAERAMSEGWDGADELRRKREELRALDEARGLSRAHGPA
ncbi:MAG: DEAD/DEAH box helicase family protein, partial [Olsenella sp.]|nr:DEAD/DEAH box helicase family protein [Olsenella sp.]